MRPHPALLAAVLVTACGSLVDTKDTSGRHYAIVRGTVTRASGAPVANAQVGISCVGVASDPFGLTVDANANGAFETDLYAPSAFAPLPGPTYICRVLTPYTGIPHAQRSVTISVSPDFKTRPVNAVSLAVP